MAFLSVSGALLLLVLNTNCRSDVRVDSADSRLNMLGTNLVEIGYLMKQQQQYSRSMHA